MIYEVLIEYRSITRIKRRARVLIEGSDSESAALAAVTFFRGENAELDRNNVRLKGVWHAGATVLSQPKIVYAQETIWAYDREAPHKGKNNHKKGKWVEFSQRERNQRNRARAARRKQQASEITSP